MLNTLLSNQKIVNHLDIVITKLLEDYTVLVLKIRYLHA